VLGALCRSPAERTERARALASTLSARFPGATFRVVDSEGSAGSGSAPARVQPSAAVQVLWPDVEPDDLAQRLRVGTPSVFARVWRGQLQLDVIALQRGDDERLAQALSALPLETSS
jgi:seryl-tRNA(Sec) selenium transferase